MKKVLPYILISFIVFANLFAPFSVGLGEKNNIEVKQNKAEAYTFGALDGTDENGISVITNPESSDTEIKLKLKVHWAANSAFTTTDLQVKRHLDETNTKFEILKPSMGPAFEKDQTGEVVFSNLNPNTTYNKERA